MYQNIFISRRTESSPSQVYVWDDEKGLCTYPWSDFNYAYRDDEKGKFRSIFGTRLSKIKRFDPYEKGLFESDVSRETRALTDLYLNSDEPSKGHNICFFDIEVSSEGGFATTQAADKEITSIAVYNSSDDTYCVFLLNPDKTVVAQEKEKEYVIPCSTEVELLESFMAYYIASKFTILTGWNIDNFDIPYLYHRMRKVLGVDMANRLSPIGVLHYNEGREKYVIAGVSTLDYIKLYKKFTFTQRPSYALNAIGTLEVGMGKVEYDGSLDDLYRNDIATFIEYNLRDVRIVVALDKKMKLIELVRFICHLGHVPYEDFGYSSKFIEGTILTYLHRKGLIAPNKPEGGREAFEAKLDEDSEGFAGAYVRVPFPGVYEWVYSLDLTSLYPSIIMSLNISPDTKVGRVSNWDVDDHFANKIDRYSVIVHDKSSSFTRSEFEEFLKTSGYCLSSNGILYRTDRLGIIPEILDKWFNERVEFKNTMKKYIKEGNLEMADYYDRRQHVQKILLNSIYGVLGLPIFRFYDLDNAEAVTATGQDVIKTTAKFVNVQYKKRGAQPKSDTWVQQYWELLREDAKRRDKPDPPKPSKEDWCVYTDTDSVYFSASELLPPDEPDPKAFTIKLANDMETAINTFYDTMALKLFNNSDHRFSIKGESVAVTGLWVAKKRYAMKKVYDLESGVDVDNKLKVTGLDVVRSSFPPAFQEFMKDVLNAILQKHTKDVVDKIILDFRHKLPTMNYMEIARNTSIKDIGKYEDKSERSFTKFPKGAPAHVKAALTYNRFLKTLGLDQKHMPIMNGDKIKWVYLKKNRYHMETIALKTYDDPPEVLELIEKYIDYDMLFEKELSNKLADFYSALRWGKLPTEVNQTAFDFFDFT